MEYDVTVIGLGCIGASTLYHLSKAHTNLNVCGIDGSKLNHNSYNGTTRLTRKGPFYSTELFELWKNSMLEIERFESISGERFYYKTGLLQFGASEKEKYNSYESIFNKNILLNNYNRSKTENAIYLAEAGYILSNLLVKKLKRYSSHNNIDILYDEAIEIFKENNYFKINLRNYTIYSKKIIISTGNNIKIISKHFGEEYLERTRLRSLIRVFHYYSCDRAVKDNFKPSRFAAFRIINDVHHMYGFPVVKNYIKVAEHKSNDDYLCESENNRFSDSNIKKYISNSRKRIRHTLDEYLINFHASYSHYKLCRYTLTKDGLPIVGGFNTSFDLTPFGESDIVLITGGNGQMFKFGMGIGKELSNWALHKECNLPSIYSHERFNN